MRVNCDFIGRISGVTNVIGMHIEEAHVCRIIEYGMSKGRHNRQHWKKSYRGQKGI